MKKTTLRSEVGFLCRIRGTTSTQMTVLCWCYANIVINGKANSKKSFDLSFILLILIVDLVSIKAIRLGTLQLA